MPPSPRILFLSSPYPHGHALTAFLWSARLIANHGLRFDLHLQSARYNAEHPPALGDNASTDHTS